MSGSHAKIQKSDPEKGSVGLLQTVKGGPNAYIQNENKTIAKKCIRVSKRYECLSKQRSATDNQNEKPETSTGVENASQTPRKRAHSELRTEGISPRKLPKTITDKIVLANVHTTEIKTCTKTAIYKKRHW